MYISDFAVIRFNEHLGDNIGDLNTPFPFMGNMSSKKNFVIPFEPRGSGYVIMQVYDVEYPNHKLYINGISLGGGAEGFLKATVKQRWRTTMDTFNQGTLKIGDNIVQVHRASGKDNILIGHLVIHWHGVCPYSPQHS